MKKYSYYFILYLLCVFSLNGCKNMINEAEPQKQVIEDSAKKHENSRKIEKLKEGFYRVGETIIWSDYYGQKMTYTLRAVRTGYNINEFGIETEKIAASGLEYISETGEALCDGEESYVFVAIDLEIKNESFKNYSNGKRIEDMYYFYIDSSIITERDLKNDTQHGGEPVYFSLCSEEERDYYRFYIEQGEVVDAKLVWIVSEKDLEEPLYYLVGGATGKDTYQYFWLNEEMLE